MSEQRRFIVSSRSIRDGYASFNGDLHHHMARVLRLRPGDELLLVDEQGRSHQGVIDQVTQEWTAVRLTSTCEAATPPVSPSITIVQGLPRGEKIDLVLQKGTELGVNGFSLFRAERSVPCLTGDKLQTVLSAGSGLFSRLPVSPNVSTCRSWPGSPLHGMRLKLLRRT